MAKTASEIVDRSLTLIDEVPTTFATAATTETSIRDMALEILPDLCRDLIKELPWDLKRYLAKTDSLTQEVLSGGEDQSSYVKQKVAFNTPTDFWELVSMKLSVWAKPVVDYIYVSSDEYSKQNNPFTRAGKQNPVVALSNISDAANARIECFSINDGDSVIVENFQYVSFDNVPDDVGNSWPDQIFDEVTKALAAQLNVIKSRMEEGTVMGSEVEGAIEQHE